MASLAAALRGKPHFDESMLPIIPALLKIRQAEPVTIIKKAIPQTDQPSLEALRIHTTNSRALWALVCRSYRLNSEQLYGGFTRINIS